MKKGRFNEEQIIGILKQQKGGQKVADLAREHGVSDATICTWKSKYGGMDVKESQRLRALDDENRRLKTLVADLSLDREMRKAVIRKNGGACRFKKGCGVRSREVQSERTPCLQALCCGSRCLPL